VRRPGAGLALLPAGLLAGVGIAIRVHNAIRYPVDWGFDASFNWRYIQRLIRDWSLPAPDATWATADPPLYFYLCALIARSADAAGDINAAKIAIPLLSTLAGLAVVALAVALVRRSDADDGRRALLAGGLLLFLPAHVYMSAMVNEEMMAALLASIVLYAVARPRIAAGDPRAETARAAGVGLAGGLALLTKLTGALSLVTAGAAYALDGWRRGTLRAAASRIAVLALVALLAGGWYYARNRIEYGYFQPHALPAHRVMFSMPPGERGLSDYLRVPLATWSDPQLLHPDLLRSVWGSTYATVWFDGHRFFLPRDDDRVRRLGTLTLLLALLPTVAFAIGLGRGLRRAWRSPDDVDTPLLLMTGLTIAGYAFFTWRNPWFAVVKGTSLLALSLPFAFYASEVLAGWTRGRTPAAVLCWLALAALAVAATLSSTFDLAFEKTEISGLLWESAE
jgi:hypothetical protein